MPSVTSTVTVEGKVPQVIPCQHCGKEFLYFMRQRASAETPELFMAIGLAEAERKAREIAQRRLAGKLYRNRFNAVPCRHCFRFQSFMRGEAAREKYSANSVPATVLVVLGGIACVIGVIVAALSNSNQTPGLVAVGVGLGVILIGTGVGRGHRARRAAYDPNTQPEVEREKLARERCLTWEEFYRKQARRIAKQYSEHVDAQQRERWLNDTAEREQPPPARLWLPRPAFATGASLPIELTEAHTVTLNVPPGTERETVIDLVPAGRNEFPFRVVLLAILEPPPQALEATKSDREPS